MYDPENGCVKYSLFLLLLTLPAMAAQADDAIKLNCPPRGQMTVSFFNYYLITMKWGDHFQVASGKTPGHTKAGVPFWATEFGNGDELTFFPNSGQYYLFYAGASEPAQCTVQGSYLYPVITPPRYENNLASSKNSAEEEAESEEGSSRVIIRRPDAQG